jgi:hypothetical protein
MTRLGRVIHGTMVPLLPGAVDGRLRGHDGGWGEVEGENNLWVIR